MLVIATGVDATLLRAASQCGEKVTGGERRRAGRWSLTLIENSAFGV